MSKPELPQPSSMGRDQYPPRVITTVEEVVDPVNHLHAQAQDPATSPKQDLSDSAWLLLVRILYRARGDCRSDWAGGLSLRRDEA